MVTPQLVGGVGLIGVRLSPFELRVIEPGPSEAAARRRGSSRPRCAQTDDSVPGEKALTLCMPITVKRKGAADASKPQPEGPSPARTCSRKS